MSATYVVKKGDTLSEIAKRYKITLAQLRKLNPKIKDPDVIHIGQKVVVPSAPSKPGTKPSGNVTEDKVPAIVTRALTKALNTHHWPQGMCDNFTANMYGHAHSGYRSAVAHWNATPSQYRHTTAKPPAGAIILYGGGSSGFGHATVALGKGTGKGALQRSIDMDNGHYSPGNVDTVTTHDVLNWGTLKLLGWIDPFYNGKLIVKLG